MNQPMILKDWKEVCQTINLALGSYFCCFARSASLYNRGLGENHNLLVQQNAG